MKKVIIVLIVFSLSVLFADDLYFKNGMIWKNCKLLHRVGNTVEIKFNEKFNTVVAKKRIDKIYGLVLEEFNTSGRTTTDVINTNLLWNITNLVKIDQLEIKMKGNDNLVSQTEYIEQGKLKKETTPLFKKIESPNYMKGLGVYSQNELLSIIEQKNKITESDKILYYYSKRKHAVPECLMNGYGLASMSQGDYGFGALIMATEIVGTIILAISLDPKVRTVGYGFVGFGFVAGIVRPIIYSNNYNEALKIGLEINYEF